MEYTFEKLKEKAWESYICLPRCNSFNSPTYEHKIGDKVVCGGLNNCVIDEIKHYNGSVLYGFTYTNASNESNYTQREGSSEKIYYHYAPWYKVRPFDITKGETNFTKEERIHIRFYNTSIDGLLSKFYLSGLDMNPPYQRDYVWSDKDKESLLDSIFNHIEIGKFAFINRGLSIDIPFEILDGKQRMSTLLDFYENRFAYKGKYFNDLSFKDRNTFLNTNITYGETENLSMEQIYEYFYKLNKCGKVMDEAHLENIREKIAESLEEDTEIEL